VWGRTDVGAARLALVDDLSLDCDLVGKNGKAAVIRRRHCQTAFSFNTLENSTLGRARIDEPLGSAGLYLTVQWIDHSD